MQPVQPPRYAPDTPLPPYAYVPGHDLPHPVTDPRGHSYAASDRDLSAAKSSTSVDVATDAESRQAMAAGLTADPRWLHAIDLFNGGWYWEAHEAWEGFWHALGRVTPEARSIQGLIHLAAAAVKIREGKPAGVTRHTTRAWELLGGSRGIHPDGPDVRPGDPAATLGLASQSLAAVIAELEGYEPQCWHSSRATVVRVVASPLRLAEEGSRDPGLTDADAGHAGG